MPIYNELASIIPKTVAKRDIKVAKPLFRENDDLAFFIAYNAML